MLAMYLVGIVTAVCVAWILKKTILKTGTSSFVMELPAYKVPSLRNVGQRMFEGGWAFVRDAGTSDSVNDHCGLGGRLFSSWRSESCRQN